MDFKIKDLTKKNIKISFDIVRKKIEDENGKDKAEVFYNNYSANGEPNQKFIDLLCSDGTRAITDSYQNMGVTCFSEEKDNVLMWSHYSSGHRGFCLQFDTRYAPFQLQDTTLINVKYVNTCPTISLQEINGNEGLVRHSLKSLASKKWKDWHYEKEWRILSWKGDISYPYDPSALCAVYLGYKMSEDDEATIRTIIAKFQSREDGSQIKIFNMERLTTEYKVVPKEFQLKW